MEGKVEDEQGTGEFKIFVLFNENMSSTHNERTTTQKLTKSLAVLKTGRDRQEGILADLHVVIGRVDTKAGCVDECGGAGGHDAARGSGRSSRLG